MKQFAFILISLFSINSFAADLAKGTVIMLADGIEISIEEVKEGDLLLTLDADNNNILVSKVKTIGLKSQPKSLKVSLADGTELVLSSEHPLLSDKGWVSADKKGTAQRNRYKNIKIRDYKIDSFIYSISADMNIEILPIISVENIDDTIDMYSLELDNENAAFIANGVFVGQQ